MFGYSMLVYHNVVLACTACLLCIWCALHASSSQRAIFLFTAHCTMLWKLSQLVFCMYKNVLSMFHHYHHKSSIVCGSALWDSNHTTLRGVCVTLQFTEYYVIAMSHPWTQYKPHCHIMACKPIQKLYRSFIVIGLTHH